MSFGNWCQKDSRFQVAGQKRTKTKFNTQENILDKNTVIYKYLRQLLNNSENRKACYCTSPKANIYIHIYIHTHTYIHTCTYAFMYQTSIYIGIQPTSTTNTDASCNVDNEHVDIGGKNAPQTHPIQQC